MPDRKPTATTLTGDIARALTSAALALPGVAASLPAAAQMAPPEHMTVGMKWLEYQDYGKKGESLMGVRAPYVYMEAPVDEHFGIEAGLIVDSIAGATPLAPVASAPGTGTGSGTDTTSGSSGGPRRPNSVQSLLSAAAQALDTAVSNPGTAKVTDTRAAFDAKGTAYFDRVAAGLGMAYSREQDWVSHTGSLDLRIATPDNNRTYALGAAFTADAISSVADANLHESRSTWEGLIGVTQVLSQTQLIQSNLGLSYGWGHFSDVYRSGDIRPSERAAVSWLTRYRHYVPAFDAALHVDYRLFADDWGMTAHTLELAWYQPLGEDWLVRPFLRYHSQDKARFYDSGAAPYLSNGLFSNDARLGSFGALAPGVAVERKFEDGWTLELHAEYYERRAAWQLTGGGSDGLEDLSAYVFIMGVRKTF
jgi:hypothetical protein